MMTIPPCKHGWCYRNCNTAHSHVFCQGCLNYTLFTETQASVRVDKLADGTYLVIDATETGPLRRIVLVTQNKTYTCEPQENP